MRNEVDDNNCRHQMAMTNAYDIIIADTNVPYFRAKLCTARFQLIYVGKTFISSLFVDANIYSQFELY